MTNLEILRKDGGPPIVVPNNAVKLEINEPLSELLNVNEIIRSLANLETLVLYVTDYGKVDLTDSLSFLRGAGKLKSLSLRSMPHLRDCAALAGCRSLEWLGLSRHVASAFDYTVLPSLTSLSSLSVELPNANALGQIAKAQQLSLLEVRGGFQLASLEPLSGLTNLEFLKLWSGSLHSTCGLKSFRKLKELNLGQSKLRDTTDLGSLKRLIKMDLTGNDSISNLEFFQEGDLEFLSLDGIPKLDSLKPISRLNKLKELLCNASVLDDDLLPLFSVPTLEKAFIAGRYKSTLKKIRVDSPCVFVVGQETLKLTKKGPVVLETASEAKARIRRMLEG